MSAYLRSILKNYLYIVSVTALGAFLCFFTISSKSYWFDESFTVIATRNFSDMQNILLREEGNMWLYYLGIYLTQKLGSSEAIIRSFSAVFAILSIPALYLLIRNLLNEKTAKIAALLLSVNFMFIYYAQTARSYSLFLFLTILSTLFFYNSFKKSSTKNLSLYALISVLGIYTHVYAGLVMLSQAATLLPFIGKTGVKKWLLTYLIVFISILPLAIAPSFNGHQINWIPKPELSAPIGTFAILSSDNKIIFGPFSFLALISAIIFLRFIVSNRLKFKSFPRILLLSYLTVPIVAAFAISITFKPLYQSVYFIFSLPPFLSLISFSLSKIKTKWLFYSLILIILLVSAWRLIGWYRQDNNNTWIISNQHEHWREAVAIVSQHSESNEAIILYPYFVRTPFELYKRQLTEGLNAKQAEIIEISPKPYLLGGGSKIEDPQPETIANLAKSYRTIWFIYVDITDVLNRNAQRARVEQLLSKHYGIVQKYDLNEIHIVKMERFQLK